MIVARHIGGDAARPPRNLAPPGFFTTLLLSGLALSCAGIRLEDIETPRVVPPGSCIAVGFLGGRDHWADESKGVRRVALDLRSLGRHSYSETFENRRRDVAEAFILRTLDRNGDGVVANGECHRVRLVIYGQSFGGAATTKFARRLNALGLPVEVTVQIDSVGRGDDEIPPNVRFAANLYQDNGWFISGEHPIRAVDPSRTRILGNWRFEYNRPPGSEIPIDDLPWWKTVFRVAHAKMDRDERVWAVVAELTAAACRGEDLEQVIPSLPLPKEIR